MLLSKEERKRKIRVKEEKRKRGKEKREKNKREKKHNKSKEQELTQKGASPGIEPGPLAPEANIIPLNYEANQEKRQKKAFEQKT